MSQLSLLYLSLRLLLLIVADLCPLPLVEVFNSSVHLPALFVDLWTEGVGLLNLRAFEAHDSVVVLL